MNALTDSFIPVRGMDGQVREVGIADALLQAHQITELADPSPLGVVSQLRLLLSVANRVFPVRGEADWLALWAPQQFMEKPLEQYFAQERERFELFGKARFYQVAELVTDKQSPLSKLVPEMVSGNNATLFDHSADGANTPYTPAEALRMMLVAQCFGLGGLLKAKGKVFGSAFFHPNTTDAVIARGVTVWLTGDNLFQTLMLNRFLSPAKSPAKPDDKDDKPCWEQKIDAGYFARSTTHGPMDRFTALGRMIHLIEDTDSSGNTVVRRMYFTQGRTFDKTAQTDPMQSYREDPKTGRRPVLVGESKATWRDLSALLEMKRESGIRPEAFDFIGQLCSNGTLDRTYTVRLNTGGMSSDKAKVNLWRHDRVALPAAFLADESLVADLGTRLSEAEMAERQLRFRTRILCGSFFSPVSGMKDANADDINRLLSQIDPRRTFWARMETRLPQLLKDMVIPERSVTAIVDWRDAIKAAFTESIDAAAAQLGPSPRAWRAAAAISRYYRFEEDKNHGNVSTTESEQYAG